MNYLVLSFAVLIAVLLAALIWWRTRKLFHAILTAAAIIALVAVALPWGANIGPVTQLDAEPGEKSDGEQGELIVLTPAMLENSRPIEQPQDGYVQSDACRECHPQQHSTWHASYHRTMAQVATPDIVLGDFDNREMSLDGVRYRLRKDKDACWVEMASQNPSFAGQSTMAPVVMTTGSHHMQVYWIATGQRRSLDLFPFVHLRETNEWIPRSAAFLRHGAALPEGEFGRWNKVCSQCHTTHRRGRLYPDGMWDTQAAEFGISCEACHGPGEEHIQFQRETKTTDKADPIVNPANLVHQRSSQVCGQCHSVRTYKEDERMLNAEGHSFRPGDDLTLTHEIWKLDTPQLQEWLADESMRERAERQLRRTNYPDGMIRIAGREYNAMTDSECYKHGEMSCLSCHQLHQPESDSRLLLEWADDQLRVDALDNEACSKCHSDEDYSSKHTHHQRDSSGSSCYNCHMPHTSYALLKAIRSHTITSPDIGRDEAANRPNACNSCHLDKTLAWSAEHLDEWYGLETPDLSEDQNTIAASLLWLLSGDAAQRALVSWSMGWREAQLVSGTDWQAPYLAQLLSDEYPAVRLIARRSLLSLPGFADLDIDVVGSSPEIREGMAAAVRRWASQDHSDNPSLLIRSGRPQIDRIEALIRLRDLTPMMLAE